jgi:hypothetical protein
MLSIAQSRGKPAESALSLTNPLAVVMARP